MLCSYLRIMARVMLRLGGMTMTMAIVDDYGTARKWLRAEGYDDRTAEQLLEAVRANEHPPVGSDWTQWLERWVPTLLKEIEEGEEES